jgi:hypothetical protein
MSVAALAALEQAVVDLALLFQRVALHFGQAQQVALEQHVQVGIHHAHDHFLLLAFKLRRCVIALRLALAVARQAVQIQQRLAQLHCRRARQIVARVRHIADAGIERGHGRAVLAGAIAGRHPRQQVGTAEDAVFLAGLARVVRRPVGRIVLRQSIRFHQPERRSRRAVQRQPQCQQRRQAGVLEPQRHA